MARFGMTLRPANSARPGSRVQGPGHDLGRPPDAPELERQKSAEGASGRDHRTARHGAVREELVKIETRKIVGKQEQAAEVGAQPPG